MRPMTYADRYEAISPILRKWLNRSGGGAETTKCPCCGGIITVTKDRLTGEVRLGCSTAFCVQAFGSGRVSNAALSEARK